jgi:hypothetical protein
MVKSMKELRQSMRRSVRWSTRVRMRRKLKELITIWVSSTLMPLLNSLAMEAKLIQVTNKATKYAHKSFLSRFRGFFPHTSPGVIGWLWIGWVVGFGWFDCFLLFVVVGARNKHRSTLLTLILTSLKPNAQFVCELCYTLLNPTQVILNHLLTQLGFLETCSQISDPQLKLGVLFASMEKIPWESHMLHMEGIK